MYYFEQNLGRDVSGRTGVPVQGRPRHSQHVPGEANDTYIHGIHGDWCRGPQVEALWTHQWIRCGRPSVSLAGSS
jgi:hypothetical protein